MSSIIFIPSLELIEIIIKSLEEKKGIKCFLFLFERKMGMILIGPICTVLFHNSYRG